MKRLLAKLRTWRSLREQRSLEQWAKQRVQGKRRFVLHTGFSYIAAVVMTSDLLDYLLHGHTQASTFSVRAICFFVMGLYIASNTWETSEGKYKIARLRGKA